MPPSAVAQHPLDEISLGLIVQIRERLLKAQAAGKKVYRLESGDPNFSVPPHVLEAVNKAGAAGKTHYIPNSGIPELRKALAEKVVRKNGIVGVTDEDIFLTNGAMHALYVAFGALLSPGDEVILPDPMWTEVAENIRLAGGVTVGVPLKADHDFEYDTAEIEAAITPRTTAIFLNTPQNPTGAVLSEQTLREMPHKHFSIGSLVPEYAEKVISIFSFSKSYAMSGLRTGYIVARSPILHDRIPKLLRCTINGVNSLAQWAALAAVTGDQSQLAQMVSEYVERRDALVSALSTIEGVRPFTPRGAFYVWADLDPAIYERLGVADAADLSDKLAAIGIGSAPGIAFGTTCDDAIRFAYSCATPMVKEGAEALKKALSDPDVLHARKSA